MVFELTLSTLAAIIYYLLLLLTSKLLVMLLGFSKLLAITFWPVLPFQSHDLITNSNYCPSYSSYDIG